MADSRIPTMPQNSEHIPTMPQNNQRVATMPQNNERMATVPQNGDRNATVPQSSRNTSTVPQNSGNVANTGANHILVHSNFSFLGENGGEYTVYSDGVVSTSSGESQIYLCGESNGEREYVARILTSITPNSVQEKLANRNKVISFLSAKRNDLSNHILPLIDYAKVSLNGSEFFVEVYPYCSEGDLSRHLGTIPYAELTQKVIPSVNAALHAFHQAGLVHRDIKPDNLYYYKDTVVVGDFGITCPLINGYASDTSKTGTLGYYAPELMSGAAVAASDYYSLGQTLWALYSGEEMYQSIFRLYGRNTIESRDKINDCMLNDKLFGLEEIKSDESFFQVLICGLLQYTITKRFGYEEIIKWLNGDRSIEHQIVNYNNKNTYRIPLKLNGKEYWDNHEVFTGLAQDWDNAKQSLYTGALKDFYYTDLNLRNTIDRVVKELSMAQESAPDIEEIISDIGLAQFLLILNDYKYLAWRGKVFYELSDLSVFIENLENKIDNGAISITDFITLLRTDLVKDWYVGFQKYNGNEIQASVVRTISEIKKRAVAGNLFEQKYATYLAYYAFSSKPELQNFCGYKNIKQIAQRIADEKIGACIFLNHIGYMAEFCAFIYVLGYQENITYIIENRTDEYTSVNMFFDFLSTQIDDKDTINNLTDCYLNFGPDSQYLWVQNNIDLYCFNGKTAEELKKDIQSVSISATTIEEIRKQYSVLRGKVEAMRKMFVDNVFLAAVGMTSGTEKDGITSSHLTAYWHKEFLGHPAPIGFYFLTKDEEEAYSK